MSTPPPPKPAIFFSGRFSLLLDTRKDAMMKMSTRIFLFAKDYRLMTSGWVAMGAVFQEIRPGAGFKTDNFVK